MTATEIIGCPPSLDHICVCKKRNCGKLKYIQPSLPKSFKPTNQCRKSNVPMATDTIHKLSYMPRTLPVKEQYPWAIRSYHKSNVPMATVTIHKLSYVPSTLPVKEQYPWAIRPYHKSNVAMATDTIHKLSYVPRTLPVKEQYPWAMRPYHKSNVPMATDTVHKLSFIPPGEFVKIDGCSCGYRGECLDDNFPKVE